MQGSCSKSCVVCNGTKNNWGDRVMDWEDESENKDIKANEVNKTTGAIPKFVSDVIKKMLHPEKMIV